MEDFDVDRNDEAMKQFNQRCACNRVYAKPYARLGAGTGCAESIRWGGHVDGRRWIHVGTSPQIRQQNVCNIRRTVQSNMKEGFSGGDYS